MSFRWKLEAQVTSGTTHWSDLTGRVREARIDRGYGSDEEEAAAGLLRATFNNDDGALTPTNSQSAYTGVDIERGVRASVVLTYDGSPYSAQAPVGSSATRLVGTTNISTGPYVVQATVTNGSTVDAWLGSSDVSSTSGFLLSTGDSLEMDLSAGDVLWGVTGTSGTVDVLAVAQPTTFRRFVGEAKAWVPQFTGEHDEVVTLDAVDGFEKLERKALSYAFRNEIAYEHSDRLWGYWPLDEDSKQVRPADLSANGRTGRWHEPSSTIYRDGQGLTFGADGITAGRANSIRWTADSSSTSGSEKPFGVIVDDEGAFSDARYLTVGTMINPDVVNNPVPGFHYIGESADHSGSGLADIGWLMRLDYSSGSDTFTLEYGHQNSTTGNAVLVEATDHIGDFGDHLVVFERDNTDRTVSLIVDGNVITTSTYAIQDGPPTRPLRVYVGFEGSMEENITSQTAFNGRISDFFVLSSSVSVLSTTSSSTSMVQLADAGLDARASETAGPRIGRLMDWASWPSTARSLSDGDTPLSGQTEVGTVLNHAQDAGLADGGVFFIDRSGHAAFQGRSDRWTGHQLTDTGRQVTFSDTGGPGYVSVGLEYDVVRLANRTEVTGSTVGTAVYQTASTNRRVREVRTISNSQSEIRSRAEWETNRWDEVHLRPDGVTISTVTTGQEVACATVDVAALVQLRRNKSGADVVSQDMRVTGLRERITEGGVSWSWEADTLDATDDQPALFDSTESFSALDAGVLGY